MSQYEWPEPEGLLALVRKHGFTESARRLGVARTTLRDHMVRVGYTAEDWTAPKPLAPEGLAEIAELLESK